MDILAVGLSLGRTALETLEAARRPEALDRAERRILALEGVREVVTLATCHRVELVLGVSLPNPLRSHDAHDARVGLEVDRGDRDARISSILDEARRCLAVEADGAPGTAEAIYGFAGTKAYRHLLRLAAGLESPLPGETEILGQMRAAYATAVETGRSSKILNGVFHRIFRAARRIRAQVGLDADAPTWSEFLANAVAQCSSLRPGASVRLVGSGSLARSLGSSLRAWSLEVVEDGLDPLAAGSGRPGRGNLDAFVVGHRKALESVGRNESRKPSRSQTPTSLRSGPVVIITASGRGRRIGPDDPAFQDLADPTGAHREVHVWDFGMPRNVDPAVAALPGVTVRTLVDVMGLGAPISSAHRQALEAAQGKVEAEVREYGAWRRERQLSSSLVRVGRMLELLSDAARGDAGVPAADRNLGDDHRGRRKGFGARAPGRRDSHTSESRSFAGALLRAFKDVAAEARSEVEAADRIALFEQVLESVVKSSRSSSIDSRPRPSFESNEALESGATAAAARMSISRITRPSQRTSAHTPSSRGWVSLVGAGPGDAGLLTLAAVARLRRADVVYHDALVTREILDYCRPDARLVDVGKRRGTVSLPQRDIEAAMIRDARVGLAVVRLKGGDPFVFGRGGEEALALSRAEIAFEIVPGVTSGVAAPAAAGIPLTHRGLSGSAAFLTAHDLAPGPDGGRAAERLRHLAKGADTLVLFMGGLELERARTLLIEAGLSPQTPAAIVENGTTPDQRVATGRLEDLHKLDANWTGGPVLVVIGETVALAESLRSGGYTGHAIAERLELSAGSDRAGRGRPPRPRISRADRRAG